MQIDRSVPMLWEAGPLNKDMQLFDKNAIAAQFSLVRDVHYLCWFVEICDFLIRLQM